MKLNVYSVKDAKAATFGNPFYANNDQVAIRSFQAVADDPNTTIHKNPEDFSLYKVAEWDDNSGEIIPQKQPKFVTNVASKPAQAVEQSIKE